MSEVAGPRMLDVNEHEISCVGFRGYKDSFTTTKAECVTRINGVAIVASDGEDGRNVYCSQSSNCRS